MIKVVEKEGEEREGPLSLWTSSIYCAPNVCRHEYVHIRVISCKPESNPVRYKRTTVPVILKMHNLGVKWQGQLREVEGLRAVINPSHSHTAHKLWRVCRANHNPTAFTPTAMFPGQIHQGVCSLWGVPLGDKSTWHTWPHVPSPAPHVVSCVSRAFILNNHLKPWTPLNKHLNKHLLPWHKWIRIHCAL